MGAENDLGLMVHQVLDGGHGGHDPLVGSDLTVLGGDIEVAAAQDPLTGYVDILNGLFIVVHNDSSKLPGYFPHFSKIFKMWEG